MIKVDMPIVVEGIYDRQKLKTVIDGFIIETNGFNIFSNKEKREFIKKLARDRGIIVMTDSDSAGFKIRNYIANICADARIINVYIPDVFGKEKRKREKSAEGKLGVEGMSEEQILSSLERAGVFAEKSEINREKRQIVPADFMRDGIAGTDNSREKKHRLLRELSLPERMSNKQLLSFINEFMSYDEYKKYIDKISRDEESQIG